MNTPYEPWQLRQYYFNNSVAEKVMKRCHNREFGLLHAKVLGVNPRISIRNLKLHNFQDYKFHLTRWDCFNKGRLYNMYYSLASYINGFPKQDTKDMATRRELNEKFNLEAWKQFQGFDFCIDIDTPTHSDFRHAVMSAQIIQKALDSFNFPYYLRFSGKGYHFITPYEFFSRYAAESEISFDSCADVSIYKVYAKIARFLNENYSALVDLNIYDSRRVLKIPYTLALYGHGAYICSPVYEPNGADLGQFYFNPIKKYDFYDAPMDIPMNFNGGSIKNLAMEAMVQ